jgi:TolA-binding protein
MSTSSPPPRRRKRHPSSRLGGRNPPPKRSRIRAIRFSLVVTAACGTLASGAYFVFRDDLFTRLIGHQTQTQINYEDQIADLRAQIDRVRRLDQERVEQQIKPLLERQATLEEVTSGLAKELSIQARNSLPPSGTIGTGSLLSSVEAASAAIVATSHAESAKQANQATIRDKKPRRPHWKHVRAKRKRVQES